MAPVTSKDKKETQHIQAFVRLRPFNKTELETHAKRILEISDKEISVLMNHGSKRFTFDKVFSMNSKQKEIYSTIISPIISEVMQGYNCTVFAYGQTGTGKTYTMIGNPTENYSHDSDCGIIPRTLEHLFENLAKNSELDFTIRISYLEIYNEILIDLLSNEDKCLKIYEDQKHKGSVQIHGLEEVTIFDKSEVYQILHTGNEKKATSSTMMNSQSSRSHTVFTITIHSKETTPDGEELVKTGKLNLVDLAGSENISRSGAIDKRAREAGNINQSLLTLGRVIKGLVEKNAHIPYRESKLTRILQDSLGGKTKTTIIATVSPASSNLDETLSTLDYAFRARNITNRPEVNQRMSKTALIQKYLEEIDRLKKDLHAARNSEGVYLNVENYNLLVEESEQRKEDLLRIIEDCTHFEGRVEELERVKSELEEVYSVTKKDLVEAEEKLDTLRRNLKRFKKHKKDYRDLVDRFEEVQEVLFEQRRGLEERLRDVVEDNEFLESKVEDLYSVIGRNDDGCKVFYELSKDRLQSFSVNFSEISEIVISNSKDLKVALLDSFAKSKETLVELKDRSVNFEMMFGETIGKLQEEIKGYHKEDFDFLVEELKVSEEVAGKILKALGSKKACLGEKLGRLWKVLEDQKVANDFFWEKFVEEQESFLEKVCGGFEEILLKQVQFGKYFENNLKDFELKQELLKHSVEDLEKNQKLLRDKISGSYEKIRVKFNELIDENLRNLGENFINENRILEKHKCNFKELVVEPQKLLVAHEVFKDNTLGICKENLENVKSYRENFQGQLVKNSVVKDNCLKDIDDCYSGVKVVLESEDVEEYLRCFEVRGKFEEEIEKRCLKQNKIKEEVQVLISRIGEFLGGFNVKCGVLEEIFKQSSSFQQCLEVFESGIREKIGENSTILEDFRDVLERFVGNLEKVSRSGQTPIGKKEYLKYETPKRVLKNVLDLSFEECQTEEESLIEELTNDAKILQKEDNFKENKCENV